MVMNIMTMMKKKVITITMETGGLTRIGQPQRNRRTRNRLESEVNTL